MFSSNTSQVSADANWIEECFSTHLYTGNGSTQTITNGIDLAGKGGLTWIKMRNQSGDHHLFDTARGKDFALFSNSTSAQSNFGSVGITSFNSNGFGLGSAYGVNDATGTYASWTFRKQAKFFDVVTWTGDGTGDRTISHNLGSVPGCIIVKRYDTAEVWQVFHRSINAGRYGFIRLDSTNAANTSTAYDWNPTSTTFVADNDLSLNFNNGTYVAYLFAHDAGGFGLTGTDNVITCGSFTTNSSSAATVNLGYEPQWLLVKSTSSGNWTLLDNMRGLIAPGTTNGSAILQANTSIAEASGGSGASTWATSTGFSLDGTVGAIIGANQTAIYIAIRRGPMKTPTTGTSVFSPAATSSSSSPLTVTTNFPVDLTLNRLRDAVYDTYAIDRLRGSSTTSSQYLRTDLTVAETNGGGGFGIGFDNNTAIVDNGFLSGNTNSKIYWNFRRAPGFFDVVCYTGTGSARTVNHNLGVVPELMIVKSRSGTRAWGVYVASEGPTKYLRLETTGTPTTSSDSWNDTTPTASVFSLGAGFTNDSAGTYVAYLFASCPGVSKVGSYTGTGNTLQVDCGFTGGARFVLIKRTDSTGDWYVWDSARGIVSGNDPYLLLNSTAAEVTNTDYVDTYSAGFEISSTAPAAINANGGTFVFLAVA